MAVIRPEKAAKVAEIKELLTASKCTILVDFCGLTVAQDTAFRRKARSWRQIWRCKKYNAAYCCK